MEMILHPDLIAKALALRNTAARDTAAPVLEEALVAKIGEAMTTMRKRTRRLVRCIVGWRKK